MAKTKRSLESSYSGELAKPIRIRGLSLGSNGPILITSSNRTAIELAREKKIHLLHEHFGISKTDQDRWEKLARALACKHVPGFRYFHRTGAPPKASIPLLADFYRYVIRLKADKARQSAQRQSDHSALRILAGRSATAREFRQKFPALAELSVKGLQNLLSEARKLAREYKREARERLLAAQHDDSDHLDVVLPWGDMPPWSPKHFSKGLDVLKKSIPKRG